MRIPCLYRWRRLDGCIVQVVAIFRQRVAHERGRDFRMKLLRCWALSLALTSIDVEIELQIEVEYFSCSAIYYTVVQPMAMCAHTLMKWLLPTLTPQPLLIIASSHKEMLKTNPINDFLSPYRYRYTKKKTNPITPPATPNYSPHPNT